MLEYDFENSLGYWVIMAARAYERELIRELEPRGITWRQSQVLGWLALEKDLSQSELAERMAIEGPTLAGILDRMERDGWIRRHDCPDDRRKKIIRPAEQALPVWEQIVRCARRLRARAAAGLSNEEVETLRRLLARVRHNLNRNLQARLP
jgi:MarR family transcriptional regulator for hemolysin